MLNQELELTLNIAFTTARSNRHECISLEHLLQDLLTNTLAKETLEACYVNLLVLHKELKIFIEKTTPVLSFKRYRM